MTADQTDRLLDSTSCTILRDHQREMDAATARTFELGFRMGYVQAQLEASRQTIARLQAQLDGEDA